MAVTGLTGFEPGGGQVSFGLPQVSLESSITVDEPPSINNSNRGPPPPRIIFEKIYILMGMSDMKSKSEGGGSEAEVGGLVCELGCPLVSILVI